MASTDLIFGPGANPPGSPVEIVFGDDDGAAGSSVTLLASGAITGLRGSIVARSAVVATASGSITGLRGSIGTQYNVNVERPVVRTTAGKFQPAQPTAGATLARYQQALALQATTAARWQDAATLGAVSVGHWQNTLRLSRAIATAWQQGQRLGAVPSVGYYQQALSASASTATRMQQAQRLPAAAVLQRMQEGIRTRAYTAQRMQQARHLAASVHRTIGTATPLYKALGGRYQEAWPPKPGIHSPTLPPQPPPCYDPSLPAHLVFADLQDAGLPAHLVFACEREGGEPIDPGETIVIPIRRVYVTVNTLTLVRASDGTPIPCAAFGMSLDVDSWTWQWQATLHAEALPLITPSLGGDPVEVFVTINGAPYRLACEGYTRNRQFGSVRIAVRGRGRAAILDAPYAPALNHGNTASRTAQQLMADVLMINGVSIGWDIDWGLTDWVVPGNVWALQGTYIAAILDIAGAAGGYVQPHDTAQTLRVLPRYPAAPWNWASLTPDFELPASVISVEGTEWLQKPAYNRVYVSGTAEGMPNAPVTRAGTAGGVLAPMVTHPLITHSDAARQRGIAELSDTGRQARLSLRLPVLEETGVIKPGALVRYIDSGVPMLGLVRSTQIEWSRPTLRQVLTIETHLE